MSLQKEEREEGIEGGETLGPSSQRKVWRDLEPDATRRALKSPRIVPALCSSKFGNHTLSSAVAVKLSSDCLG